MYMSQHRFTPVPSKFDLWLPYNRNYMTLTGRAPGAVLSRILRLQDQPEEFFALGLWTGHEAAVDWSNSAEAKLGAKPSLDQGLYDGLPMTWTRWELVDFAWGVAGPAGLTGPGLFVKHVAWDVAPGMRQAFETFNRAVLSLMARRPGFVSGETYRGHRGERLQSIYTFRDRTDWPFGAEPPADLQMLLQSDAARSVRDSTPAPALLDCTLFESVWGPDRADLQRFIGAEALA